MADVDLGMADRGQLLLIAALGMAILFVALAVILNTGIYTENLATRSSDIAGGSDALRFAESAEVGGIGLVERTNQYNNSSHDSLQTALVTGVTVWTNTTGKLTATRGTATSVELVSTTNGTRLVQDNATRDFTNESGNATAWTLVTDAENTRKFRINVTDYSSLGGFGSGNAFTVIVDNSSATWRFNITANGSQTTIGIRNQSGGEQLCTVSSQDPWVNVTDATVNGTNCTGLVFAEGIDPPYSITYENSDNITGTYQLIVDNETLATNADPHFHAGGGAGSPYVTPAVYAAELRIAYYSSRLNYTTTTRIAPGEPQ